MIHRLLSTFSFRNKTRSNTTLVELTEGLERWCNAQPQGNKENAEKAKLRILDAYNKNNITLNLANLQLSSLPAEIGSLSNLQMLDLPNNQLENLPAEIGSLSNLQALYLHNNRLRNLPAEIGNLSNLQMLDLPNNQLENLPAEIGSLSNLQMLYLHNNQLRNLPAEIGNLLNLQQLLLHNNPLTPAAIEFLNDNPDLHAHYNMAAFDTATSSEFYRSLVQGLDLLDGEKISVTNLIESNPGLKDFFNKIGNTMIYRDEASRTEILNPTLIYIYANHIYWQKRKKRII